MFESMFERVANTSVWVAATALTGATSGWYLHDAFQAAAQGRKEDALVISGLGLLLAAVTAGFACITREELENCFAGRTYQKLRL
jgi:hypothetical protein